MAELSKTSKTSDPVTIILRDLVGTGWVRLDPSGGAPFQPAPLSVAGPDEWFFRSDSGDVEGLVVGKTTYHWTRTFRESLEREGPQWVYRLVDFRPDVIGEGLTPRLAKKAWIGSFHNKFQTLKRDHDSLPPGPPNADWEAMKQVVDMERYRAAALVQGTEGGEIVARDDWSRTVRWTDEDDVETVPLDRADDAFARLEKGDVFVATVERVARTQELREIQATRIVPPPEPVPPERKDELAAAEPGSTSEGMAVPFVRPEERDE